MGVFIPIIGLNQAKTIPRKESANKAQVFEGQMVLLIRF